MSILEEVAALKSAAEKGALVQEEAAKNLAAELDDQAISKSGNQSVGEDLYGVHDYYAEDLMGQYAEIPLEFERTWGADPEQIEGIVQRLLRVSLALRDSVIDDEIEQVMNYGTTEWDGEAGAAYRSFITPLQAANRNQLLLVDSMIVALQSNQEVLRKAHGDVDVIASQTIRALRRSWGDGLDGTAAGLYVLNLLVAATLAALPAVGPAAAAVSLSVTASVAGSIWNTIAGAIGSSLPGETVENTPADFDIGATNSYTSDIIKDMYEALSQVRTAVDSAELELANALQAAYDLIGTGGSALFKAPRPAFTDADPSEYTGDGPNGFGNP